MKLEGIDALNRKLKDLENKVQGKIARKGLRAGAKITMASARSEAPKESGTIERNIKVRAGRSRKGRISIIVGLAKKWYTGPAFYAAFVEYGHRIGSRRLGDARQLQPANDFMRRANESTKDEAAQTAVDVMWEAMMAEL